MMSSKLVDSKIDDYRKIQENDKSSLNEFSKVFFELWTDHWGTAGSPALAHELIKLPYKYLQIESSYGVNRGIYTDIDSARNAVMLIGRNVI
jgi:hypothetical protein